MKVSQQIHSRPRIYISFVAISSSLLLNGATSRSCNTMFVRQRQTFYLRRYGIYTTDVLDTDGKKSAASNTRCYQVTFTLLQSKVDTNQNSVHFTSQRQLFCTTYVRKSELKFREVSAAPTGLVENKRHRILLTASGKYWIPDEDVQLKLRICVVAHCGKGGHRGQDSTFRAIKKQFTWKTIVEDVTEFCRSCLHCLSTIGGHRVPRVMGHAMHSDKPNKMDFR